VLDSTQKIPRGKAPQQHHTTLLSPMAAGCIHKHWDIGSQAFYMKDQE